MRPLLPPDPQKVVAKLHKRVRKLEHRFVRAGPPIYHVKVVSDFQTVVSGEGKFIFEIPQDMNGMKLSAIEAYVTTVSSSGLPSVGIRKVPSTEMLSTNVTIDASEKNSKDAATPAVINAANAIVTWGDHIAIDVDAAGTGAKGLGVILTFQSP